MKKSEIKLTVDLDDKNVPEKIVWETTDGLNEKPTEVDSMSVALWDSKEGGTMKLDLWTKAMSAPDMKKFIIEAIGSLGEVALNATNDEEMYNIVKNCCDDLAKHFHNNN